jgi:hypothetical protein
MVSWTPRIVWGIHPFCLPIFNRPMRHVMLSCDAEKITTLNGSGHKSFEDFAYSLLSPLGGVVVVGCVSGRHMESINGQSIPGRLNQEFILSQAARNCSYRRSESFLKTRRTLSLSSGAICDTASDIFASTHQNISGT